MVIPTSFFLFFHVFSLNVILRSEAVSASKKRWIRDLGGDGALIKNGTPNYKPKKKFSWEKNRPQLSGSVIGQRKIY